MILEIPRSRELVRLLMLLGIIGVVSGCASQPSQQPSSPSTPQQSLPSPSSTLSSADSAQETVTIRVQGAHGTQKVPFSGTYGMVGGAQRNVIGTTPAKYQVNANSVFDQYAIVRAVMWKQADDDTELTVLVVSGGEIKEEQSTTEPFGVVGVDYALSNG